MTIGNYQSLKRKRNALYDNDEPSSLRRSSRIKAQQTTMNANIETYTVKSKASKQKNSNKIAKKTTITGTVNASNDTGDVKSKASEQKKITDDIPIRNSHRSPRVILNRIINLEEYNMITLKEGKTNHSKKPLIVFNNEISNHDDIYTLESNDCLPRRSKRTREAMIKSKKLTTDNQSEKKKKKTKVGAKLSLVERINNESPANEFFTNEIVFATIPGYCPWPAAIMNINEQTIFVKFFGTGQM